MDIVTLIPAGMNWVDGLAFAVIVFAVITGVGRGFVQQILFFLAALLGIKLAVDNCVPFDDAIVSLLPVPRSLRLVISFIAVYAIVSLACRVLAALWGRLTDGTPVSWLDAVGGGVLAGLRSLMVLAICVQLISAAPMGALSETAGASYLSRATAPAVRAIWKAIPGLTDTIRRRIPDGGLDMKATHNNPDGTGTC